MNLDSASSDLALLRRFEPVIRYTRGEQFFPMEVDRYVRQCSLWVQCLDESPKLLVPEGELTLEKLAEPRQDGFGAVYYLKFIEPLDIVELATYSVRKTLKSLSRRDPQNVFRAGRGRLARVGYGSRFVDALFSITLLARGRVPGDTAAAATLTYRQMQAEGERYCYHGRAARVNGWIALQYWFFYPFNNWRSGFFGVNDHESDWEMVYVYCAEHDDGAVTPEWVAYASHDFSGDDLRRRWDDPEVEKIGEHPIIYAGAGSHASYFSSGEYLAEIELPFLSPLVRLVDKAQDFWVSALRQAGAKASKPEFNVFRIPFVDYARGDGLSIGPGQPKEWEPHLLNPPPAWALGYRGLWGLYAHDPIAGENAPAGPVYNRDGLMRRSWYDPLGWAGLDKVPPPDEALEALERQRAQIETRRTELEKSITEKSAELAGLGLEAAALGGHPHLRRAHEAQLERVNMLSKELSSRRSQLALDDAKLEAVGLHEARLKRGDPGPLRAHIHHAHHPSSDADQRLSRLAEAFAAVSIGLLMIGFVLLIAYARHYLLFGLAAILGAIIFVEAGFRRQLAQLVASLTVGSAIVSTLILLYQFFWQIVVMSVLAAGLYIMWENVRELRG